MSEQNILNPDPTSELSPDYGHDRQDQSAISVFRPTSGSPCTRLIQGRGRVFNLPWNKRLFTTMCQLMQWERQYRYDFFTYYDVVSGRYFSGNFLGPLQSQEAGNDKWDIKGQFEEQDGYPLYQYPGEDSLATNAAMWLRDSVFIEERDSRGNDLAKMTAGSWTTTINANCHGGKAYYSNVLDATAEWLYFGYGFRIWCEKQSAFGKVEISLDGTVLSTVDLYNAASLASAPVYRKIDVALGLHRVKLRCTHTKNVSSADYFVTADAIEVMQ
jgi:hypothetical protein